MSGERIVIVIPGIVGSVLARDGREIWPGRLEGMVGPYGHMDDLLADGLEPVDIVRSFCGVDQYGSLLAFLEQCGFEEPGTLYTCPYDWRRSNRLAAEALSRVVERAASAHRFPEIHLIAHSMGGLIARYYLESGEFDDRPGFNNVRSVVLLGTPHRGAPIAFAAALGGLREMFLDERQVRSIASDPRFPSTYELMPDDEPFLWCDEERCQPIDLRAPGMLDRFGLIPENMEAGRRFWDALDLMRKPAHVEYHSCSGGHMSTPSYGIVNGGVKLVEVAAGGDGIVPAWSTAPDGVVASTFAGEHGTFFRNCDLQHLLQKLFAVRCERTSRAEVFIREKVCRPGQLMSVLVSAPAPGDLWFEGHNGRCDAQPGEHHLNAPQVPGIHKLCFRAGGIEAADEFFVQQP